MYTSYLGQHIHHLYWTFIHIMRWSPKVHIIMIYTYIRLLYRVVWYQTCSMISWKHLNWYSKITTLYIVHILQQQHLPSIISHMFLWSSLLKLRLQDVIQQWFNVVILCPANQNTQPHATSYDLSTCITK